MHDWRPTATRRALVARAEFLRRTRAFFDARGVLEVETPYLSPAAPTDLHLAPVVATVSETRRHLHTSPEFAMKRLLAAGAGDCWQLCRVFRDGEQGALHNPEFTLLEWYRLGLDDAALMDEVDSLMHALCNGFKVLGPTTRVAYADAFRDAVGVAHDADAGAIARALREAGVVPPADADRATLVDFAAGALMVPALGRDGPCFVVDYPADQAALARLRGELPVAARFELVIDGVELANGYHELTDAAEQRRRFDADNAARAAAGRPVMPVDERLLAALEHGLPDCAGVAVGFDRVLMLALGAADLSEVLAFRA